MNSNTNCTKAKPEPARMPDAENWRKTYLENDIIADCTL